MDYCRDFLILFFLVQVPAMRCKVETRKVVKTKPETKCERVPKETCRKHACNPLPTKSSERRDESGCYMMEKTVSEIIYQSELY